MNQRKLFNIYNATGGNFAGWVYDPSCIAPCLSTMGGGNQQPLITENMTEIINRPHGFNKGNTFQECTTITKSGWENNNFIMQQKTDKPRADLPEELRGKKFRIRKLTPRECFRLQGVDDKDIDKIQSFPYETLVEHPAYSKAERFRGMSDKEKRAAMKHSISNSAQYRLAGNSIVVDVLYHLFRKMFVETGADDKQPTLF